MVKIRTLTPDAESRSHRKKKRKQPTNDQVRKNTYEVIHGHALHSDDNDEELKEGKSLKNENIGQ